MFLPTMIKLAENGVNMLSKPGTSAAKVDDLFYDTKQLSPEERRQAMALLAEQKLPEGSIFVMEPGKRNDFGVVPNPEEENGKIASDLGELGGRERGAKVVEMFLNNPEHSDWADIETVVLPGNASSPLGTAALGKMAANLFETKVAAIVVGQGAFDQWMESASGGMLMAPMANTLSVFNSVFEFNAKAIPMADIGAKFYVNDLLDAMHDAATLFMLLKAGLVDGSFNNLKMIVSHSKGNWAVLAALLAFELELIKVAKKPKEPKEPIKVVTFCNPVALPDMKKEMEGVFKYFQFVGEVDKLAHNCSAKAWTLHFNSDEKLNPIDPDFDSEYGPRDRMVADVGHHLVAHTEPEFPPFHMPIEKILPIIREH